jgi:hypothetical protein
LASKSYAYKFSRYYGERDTEYLYEHWFDSYTKYINHARNAAESHEDCVVIQTDIKSFYTRIVRDQLAEISSDQLTKSSRVEWLLRILFSHDIDEHEAGLGIVQGNIGSGFFANLYLIDLDARFSSSNEWNVEFFRFVDDMLLVVPNPEHVDEVLEALREELAKLQLELNDAKTECYYDVAEFMKDTEADEILDTLHQRFQELTNNLWITNSDYRQSFRKSYFESNDEWWYRIQLYQECLESIDVFISSTLLSRRIYKYLFNQKKCESDLTLEKPLVLPDFPDDSFEEMIYAWSTAFEDNNAEWILERNSLRSEIISLLNESWDAINRAIKENDSNAERKWTRRIRFCFNKLKQLGFEQIADTIVQVLRSKPWLIRNPSDLIEGLAAQGFTSQIISLLSHYTDETDAMQEYMKAITLRAIRFLPHVTSELWTELVNCSVSPSMATSLLATETWLHIGQE